MAQEVYVVIEFDRETDEFSEVEGVFQSKEEAEDFAKECSARYLRYSYGCYEGTYDADEVDAVLAEKDSEIRRLKRALWLARALFCGRSSEYFSGMASRCKIGQEDFYREVSERARRYMKSSYKCQAKAEEYKL